MYVSKQRLAITLPCKQTSDHSPHIRVLHALHETSIKGTNQNLWGAFTLEERHQLINLCKIPEMLLPIKANQ